MAFDPEDVESLAEAYTGAWNSGSPQSVAGFFADVPGMKPTCDGVRCAGLHVVYLWTFTGHAVKTANALTVHGWEEGDAGDNLKVKASRGWYDSEDKARQVAGGTA
jgi:hypothetical protein